MRRRGKKGIVGIEAAIVMIAFIIVAAALAFVTLNMGMFTTQKSKEVIGRGLGEASSALEVDGIVTGYVKDRKVKVIIIPLKTAPGREAIDVNRDRLAVKLIINGSETGGLAYEDIYYGVNKSVTSYDIETLAQSANESTAMIVFINGDGDDVLEFGEKAVLVINMTHPLDVYDTFIVEIRPVEGAPLTIERMIPPTIPSQGAVNLG